MACNTAHAFQSAIIDAVDIPFLGMIQGNGRGGKSVAVSAQAGGAARGRGCLDACLYQQAFAAEGIRTLVPEGSVRESFMRLLYGIKAGNTGPSARREMKALADHFVDLGGEAVIAGSRKSLWS